MQSMLSCLQSRGIVANFSAGLDSILGPVKVYMGFDPTADSLHLGHLSGIVLLRLLIASGHQVVVLIGGATGMIGDPSGKSEERNLLSSEIVYSNARSIGVRLKQILGVEIEIVNNADWFEKIYWIDFLRDVGKYFRLGSLLSKESVKKRLLSEEGISFTEFSYQLLQAYDFYHLREHYGVSVQLGGSDQWGNIVGGIDFIRRKTGKSSYGLTYPLLLNSEGKKIGKTESGALWLNVDRTSPYQFYQYLLRLPDGELPGIMRSLTLMDNEAILENERMLSTDSEQVRQLVADLITSFVHGEAGLYEAKELTGGITPGKHQEVGDSLYRSLVREGSYYKISFQKIVGKRWVDILVDSGFCSSKGEARRLINQGGIYINGFALKDEGACVLNSDFVDSTFIIIGQGKKRKVALCNEE